MKTWILLLIFQIFFSSISAFAKWDCSPCNTNGTRQCVFINFEGKSEGVAEATCNPNGGARGSSTYICQYGTYTQSRTPGGICPNFNIIGFCNPSRSVTEYSLYRIGSELYIDLLLYTFYWWSRAFLE